MVHINKTHIHTPNTLRKITLKRDMWYPLPFLKKKQPHLFHQLLHFFGKNLNPTFFKNFKTFSHCCYKEGGQWFPNMLWLFQLQKVTFTDQKNTVTCSLKEADNFGCLRFDDFDFQIRFNIKYTIFVFKKKKFFLMIYSLSILGKNDLFLSFKFSCICIK